MQTPRHSSTATAAKWRANRCTAHMRRHSPLYCAAGSPKPPHNRQLLGTLRCTSEVTTREAYNAPPSIAYRTLRPFTVSATMTVSTD